MHVYTIRLFLLTLALLPAMACAVQPELPAEPPEGLDVAWFHDDCAPWDGPATTIYLGREAAETVFASPFPSLRVTLYSNRAQLDPHERLHFEIPGNDGHAVYCSTAEECEAGTSVSIEFAQPAGDELEGRLEVTFPNRPPIRGSFQAMQMPFQALCG